MNKILVPIDFSPPSFWALEVAVGIAKKARSQITLLHVIERPIPDSFNAEGEVFSGEEWEDKVFMMKLIEASKDRLEKAEKLVQDGSVVVKRELKLGNPFHGIRSVITEHEVDLVVMGTTGFSNCVDVLVGSNAEKIVRYSKCPVLTVHQKPIGLDFINIVYASSLNDSEKAFAVVVKNFQNIYNAKIHLVRINTPMNFRPDVEVKRVMQNFARKCGLRNYILNTISDRTEEDGILNFASSVNADLIAMATHGRTGFAHVLVGSIAEDVVNHASRPVLTFVTPNA